MLIIAGPTAVGKSEIAVSVAEACDGEIVGADAFQVYEGMEIVTAKPGEDLLRRVPHHLIGSVPASERYDVAQYLSEARDAIAQIRRRGRVPIVVGGTGLYIRALTHGLAELPGADPALRQAYEALPFEVLQARLLKADPGAAQTIDLKNRRRVTRALEVCELTGEPFTSFRRQKEELPEGFSGVLLTRGREELYRRIDERVGAMFEAGLLEEVRRLTQLGPTAAQAIGIAQARACLRGEMTEREARESIASATRRFAKRQLTWFRRETMFEVIHLSGSNHTSSLVAHLAQCARPASRDV